MYFKLAMKNVKKSFKDFLIYFLTLAFSVCLFYTFNSFQAQQAVLEMNQMQMELIEMLGELMTLLSVFVAFVLAFLILYANNFLIKRRKKELGLYTLLGMPKGKISKILVYETFLIGFISLIIGMVLGTLLSQFLTIVNANLFDVPLHYTFVFSMPSFVITLCAFGGIFLITMLFNTVVLNRYKLIDLLTADRKNDELTIKKVGVSLLIFLTSLIFLGGAYYTSMHLGFEAFLYIVPICIAGIIGTILFFLSLAGFMLTVVKANKRIYLKNLNAFVLRQINSNINTNFISMSIVCIMLLLSIGALSTGLSLNQTINKTIAISSPYDYTMMVEFQKTYTRDGSITTPSNADDLIKQIDVDSSHIKSSNYAYTYLADIGYEHPAFIDNVDKTYKEQLRYYSDAPIQVTPLSTFNKELRVRGLEPITLNNKQVYLYSNTEMVRDAIEDILAAKPTIPLYGHELQVSNDDYEGIIIGTSNYVNMNVVALVVDDSLIPNNAPKLGFYWNVNVNDSITDNAFSDIVATQINSINEALPENTFIQPTGTNCTKSYVYENSKGLSVVMTYIGIYLGSVFLIASAVILALQQLSLASDNKKRYRILHQIGVEKRMMNRSILLQIAIYFILPLALAIAHSYVGIHVVNQMVINFGKSDIMLSSIITAGIIIVVYGSYFLVTYFGYKNIIKD